MDVYFSKFEEHITFSKPIWHFKNLIWGGLYTDIDGDIKAINHQTGHTLELQFYEKKSEKENSKLTAQAFDPNG